MRKLIILQTILVLSGCATADPNRNWIKTWNNDGFSSLQDKENLTQQAERSDYIRYSRELAGVVNKNFSSTPMDPVEREFIYYSLALAFMNKVQYANFRYATNQRENFENITEAKVKMGIYMRKLMELPNLHRMSMFLICRIQELSGNWNACPSQIRNRVEPGALLWVFSNNPSTQDNFYLLNDFTDDDRRISLEKRGGGFITLARTVCGLFCLGGFRGDDELVIQEVGHKIGLKMEYKDHYGKIIGETAL